MTTLYILYGSATGNAEYIAKDLAAKDPPAPYTSVVCEALEKFKKHADGVWSKPPSSESGARKHGLIVVCSTTGNGDAPENASRFVRYIKRKQTLESYAMAHMAYAVLGLGDTNYDIFCGAAKQLDKKLEEAGGERIKALTCADEATGLEDVVEPWTETILKEITNACFSPQKGETNGNKMESEKKKEEKDAVKDESASPAQVAKEAPAAKRTTTKESPASVIPKTLDTTLKADSPLFILYGSATGNAEQIAKDLTATYESLLKNPDAFTYFPSVVCCDLNGWRKQGLPIWEQAPDPSKRQSKHGVIIVTSTTGNADAPENADRFVRWLKRKQTVASMPFSNVAYAVLGLGDTNYDVFCATGKLVDKKCLELGGARVKPAACADEATGLEDVVNPWVSSILLEMSIACQAAPALGSDLPVDVVASTVKDQDDAGEEKKMDAVDNATTTTTATTDAATKTESAQTPELLAEPSSSGVRNICSILDWNCNAPLQSVDHKCLPHIGSSLSSCQLLTKLEEEEQEQLATADDDRMTVSSASSSNIHYTLKKPFESSILNARYLTTTPTVAAQKAAELLSGGWNADNGNTDHAALIQQAMDVYTEQFPLLASETASKEQTERNSKRVIELTLALPDDFTLEYNPGDSLGLIVENLPTAVDFVLNMLREAQGILPDQHVSIDSGNPITVREAIRQQIDLCSPLKSKRILSSLAQYANNAEEKKALQLLASKTPAGEKAFEEFVDKQRLSVVDLLHEFPSLQSIPLSALLSILPGIPPRYYSVSSSPLERQQDLSLTVSFSVVDYVTPSLKMATGGEERGLRRKKGIATRHLEVLASPFLAQGPKAVPLPTKVKIFPKPTAEFRMPSSISTPMVLVGPGTGIGKYTIYFIRNSSSGATTLNLASKPGRC